MAYELKSARFLARDALARCIQPGDTVVDATMGNGYDTLFLCKAVGPSGRVYAFDVQPQAVAATRTRLGESGFSSRACLFCAGHQDMDQYVTEPVKAVVFNLGWLPGGDHAVTTRRETTIQAVKKSLDLLLASGILVICVYPGHPEGDLERLELLSFLSSLPNRMFNVLHQRFPNASPGAPECFIVQKMKEAASRFVPERISLSGII